jgi:hypothetical protein
LLNLVRLRERAAYPDGREASGAEAYEAYGRESLPVFKRLGGAIVWRGRFELMLIGPEDERWDLCFVAQYPTVAAFVEMIPIPSIARRSGTGRRRWRIAADPARARAPGLALAEAAHAPSIAKLIVGWQPRSSRGKDRSAASLAIACKAEAREAEQHHRPG